MPDLDGTPRKKFIQGSCRYGMVQPVTILLLRGEQVQLMVNMTSANALCSFAAWPVPQIVFASIFLCCQYAEVALFLKHLGFSSGFPQKRKQRRRRGI